MGNLTLEQLSISLRNLKLEGFDQVSKRTQYGMTSQIILHFQSDDGLHKVTIEAPMTKELYPENIDKVKNQYFGMDLKTPIV